MIPIYEQGKGQGIGHSSRSFTERFEVLCAEHVQQGRARAFAFIFYDFLDRDFRRILKSQGVFAELDRMSDSDLSISYLNAVTKLAVDRFNAEFMRRLGVNEDVQLPCVVFFRVADEKITNVAVAQLESADLIHGFHELYSVIQRYLTEDLAETPIEQSKYLRWFRSGLKFISLEAFKAALKHAIQAIF